MAAVNRNADPILTEALDGTPNTLDSPAPPFALTDQHGRPVSLAEPARPRRRADLPRPRLHLGLPAHRPGVPPGRPAARRPGAARSTSSPSWPTRSTAPASFTNAFDRQEGLTHLANWYYLTGSVAGAPARLGLLRRRRCRPSPTGAMVAHSDLAFVIDRARSRTRRAHRRPRPHAGLRVVVLLTAPRAVSTKSSIREAVPAAVAPAAPACGRWRHRRLPPCVLWPSLGARRRRRGGRRRRVPLPSGVSTPDGSWVVLPMGQLSDPTQHLLAGAPRRARILTLDRRHARGRRPTTAASWPARPRRSIAGRDAAERPAPLLAAVARAPTAGATWSPVFLPGALARAARRTGRPETSAPPAASPSWATHGARPRPEPRVVVAPGVPAPALHGPRPRCDASALDAVAFASDGRRRWSPPAAGAAARVGLFTQTDGSWQSARPDARRGPLAGSSTERPSARAPAGRHDRARRRRSAGHQTLLVACWQSGRAAGPRRPRSRCRARTRSRRQRRRRRRRRWPLMTGPNGAPARLRPGPRGRAWSRLPAPPLRHRRRLAVPGDTARPWARPSRRRLHRRRDARSASSRSHRPAAAWAEVQTHPGPAGLRLVGLAGSGRRRVAGYRDAETPAPDGGAQ